MSLRILSTLALAALASTPAHAQGPGVSSTDFQEIFLTAGYATLFGAATGTALLPFLNGTASQNLRFVAGGASIGFLTGSAVAFYTLTQRETALGAPGNDDVYGMQYNPEESNRRPLALGPRPVPASNCRTTPALFQGCNAEVALGLPAFAISPSRIDFSLIAWRF